MVLLGINEQWIRAKIATKDRIKDFWLHKRFKCPMALFQIIISGRWAPIKLINIFTCLFNLQWISAKVGKVKLRHTVHFSRCQVSIYLWERIEINGATRGYTNGCCITIGTSQIHVGNNIWSYMCIEHFQLWKHWVEHNAATDTLNILLQHRMIINGFSLTNEWKIKINYLMFFNSALLPAF